MANTEENYAGHPPWVEEQRYSWHGVDYMYHGEMDLTLSIGATLKHFTAWTRVSAASWIT